MKKNTLSPKSIIAILIAAIIALTAFVPVSAYGGRVYVADETDSIPADDLAELQSFQEAMLEPGYVVSVHGVRVLALGGFASALSDQRQKQLMWARLKQIPPLGEPF